jgi:hypothetical protein
VTQQIIQTPGGFMGVNNIAVAEMVKLLNEVSRRPLSGSIHHQEFRNKIANAVKDHRWRGRLFRKPCGARRR